MKIKTTENEVTSKGMLGKKHSQKTKQKMSLSQKGHIVSEETKRRISKAQKGKKYSKETNLKKGLTEEKHPNWKGDKVGYDAFTRLDKKKIREGQSL